MGMNEAFAVVKASELETLRAALAKAFDALECLERGLVEDPTTLAHSGMDTEDLAEVF
jgi:hypothetical protein